ncbi:hypothetical protein JCM19233_6182 [Vibrio astriarenae]|nr:hypothetical protein JCM19233_6182 [Vibrio sp. C7]
MNAINYYNDKIKGFEAMTFEERREQFKALGLDDVKAHTKATLKGLFRVKPAKDAEPCSSYKNDYKKIVNLYHLNQCTPMRALPQNPRSEAQKAATQKMVRLMLRTPREVRRSSYVNHLLKIVQLL